MMNDSKDPISILVADDDADDRMMIKDAFVESRLANPLHFVEDGEELMDFLHRRGKFSDPALSPTPGLILLDLNMPRKDGREALKEIYRTYDMGVNSYITKPVTFVSLVDLMKILATYWFEIVRLPNSRS